MLRNSPGDIFRLVDRPQFLAVRQGVLPMHDVFQAWLTDQQNKTYFFAMKQISHKLYIGAEVATETLKQRFHGVLQKRWNPEYLLLATISLPPPAWMKELQSTPTHLLGSVVEHDLTKLGWEQRSQLRRESG